MNPQLPKFSAFDPIAEVDRPHDHGLVFVQTETSAKRPRLCIGASRDGSALLRALANALTDPVFLLYVLVVPRGEAPPGRYQSPPLERPALEDLFKRYGDFWDSDGRHHVWIHSPADGATLVYDRHNLIYAYGPLERFVAVLDQRGYQEKNPDALAIPCPHSHHYHEEWDATARALHAEWGWRRTDLRPADEE